MDNLNKSIDSQVFYFSPALVRVLARWLDTLFVCLVHSGFAYFYYFLCDPGKNVVDNITNTNWWQIDLYVFLVVVGSFVYFIVLPWVWKGQTFFRKLFKIRMISFGKKNAFFWHLIKHDFFIWIDFSLLILIFMLVLSICYGDQSVNKVLEQNVFIFYSKNYFEKNLGFTIFFWFFRLAMSSFFLIDIFILVNTVSNSRFQTICDMKSNTAIVLVSTAKKSSSFFPCSSSDDQSAVTDLPGWIDKNSNLVGEDLDLVNEKMDKF